MLKICQNKYFFYKFQVDNPLILLEQTTPYYFFRFKLIFNSFKLILSYKLIVNMLSSKLTYIQLASTFILNKNSVKRIKMLNKAMIQIFWYGILLSFFLLLESLNGNKILCVYDSINVETKRSHIIYVCEWKKWGKIHFLGISSHSCYIFCSNLQIDGMTVHKIDISLVEKRVQ